jgi:hypothetical protein
MQSKIAVVKMLENFKFSLNEKTTTPIQYNPSAPFVTPVGGLWLNIEKV